MTGKEGRERINKAIREAPLERLLSLAAEQLIAIKHPSRSDMPVAPEEVRLVAVSLLGSLTVEIIKRVETEEKGA